MSLLPRTTLHSDSEQLALRGADDVFTIVLDPAALKQIISELDASGSTTLIPGAMRSKTRT
jgi:hypothetical protein